MCVIHSDDREIREKLEKFKNTSLEKLDEFYEFLSQESVKMSSRI